ncbi:MAG: GAF domain-containing sensor histidine kinase [Planctomycetes bacterium]|nr:GAF domain-containing sensor histidine kinase [Planctomycetota bacterium]
MSGAEGEDASGQSMEREVRELRFLSRIQERLFEPFDLDDLVREIIGTCRALMEADHCRVLLAGRETGALHLYWCAGAGPGGARLQTRPVEEGQGIAGWVAAHGETVRLADARSDPRVVADVDGLAAASSGALLCVPMTRRGEVLGVLQVVGRSRGGFSTLDGELLGRLAARIAVALDNAWEHSRRREADRMAALGRAVARVLHDLKNPMQVLHGFVHLLEGRPGVGAADLEPLRAELEHMRRLLQELLSYARGETAFAPRPTEVRPLLDEVALAVGPEARRRGVALEVEGDCRGPVALDRDRFRRALLNLVFNGVEAMPDGGRLRLRLSEDGARVRLQVEDEGVGMPPEVRRAAFRPFYSAGKGGTGLGLTIVREVVGMHGGLVLLDSEEGRGTIVTVLLPRPAGGEARGVVAECG